MSAPEPELELLPTLRAFSRRTKAAALALYTNIHACVYLPGVPEAQCAVAQNLFALAGMVEMLIDSLSSSPFDVLSSGLTPQDVQTLERCVALCGTVLDAVDVGVKVADEYVNPNSKLRLEKGPHRLGAFSEGAVEERRIVQTYLHEVVRLGMKVRSKSLEQRAELTDAEAGESLRLETALKHADLNKSITAMSVSQKVHFVPQVLQAAFPKSIIQMDAIPPQPYQQTEYIQSLSYSFSNQAPNPAPFQNVVGEAASKSTGDSTSAETKNDADPTPASTRESTPTLDGSFVDVSSTSGAQQAKDTPDSSKGKEKASVDNTTGETEARPSPPIIVATNASSTSPPLHRFNIKPLEHLEVYMMHPHADSFVDSITWTSKIELLRLHESALQAHLQKLDPNHSVIAELSKLPPHQVRFIQNRAKDRLGHLVSVEKGRLVDVLTQMGTFQVRQIIFALVTSQPPEVERVTPFRGLFGQPQSNPLGGFGTASGFVQPQSTGLFGQNNGPVQDNRFTLPTRGLFGNAPPPPNPPASISPKDYETQLRERGEECFLVENDTASRQLQQYMTITTGNRYAQPGQDHSLEEMRVEDYAAGRQGPAKVNPFLYSWEKAFGGQYTNPKPRQGLFGDPASSSSASNRQQPTTGGLFGNMPSSQTQTTPGGLFGNARPASGSLFGNAAASNPQQPAPVSGGLFGNQQQRPSGGLFRNLPASSQQPSPFSGGLFGDQQRSSGGLFGKPASPNPQQQQTSSGDLFGTPPSSSSAPAQNQPSGGLFGNPASSTAQPAQPSGSLFGNPASPSPQQVRKEPTGGLNPTSISPTQPQQPVPPSSQNVPEKPTSPNPQPQSQAQPQTQPPSSQPTTGLFARKPHTEESENLLGRFGPGSNNSPSTSLFGTSPSHTRPGVSFGETASPHHFRTPFSNFNKFGSSSTAGFVPNTPTTGALFGSPTGVVGTGASSAAAGAGGSSAGFGSASGSGSGAGNASVHCKQCATSLVFHPAAEQGAKLCDACKGEKGTACWLCVRKMEAAATTTNPSSSTSTTQNVKSEDVDDDDKEEEEEEKQDKGKSVSTPQPQSKSPFAFAKYKGEAGSPFAALSGGKKAGEGFSFGGGDGGEGGGRGG